MSDTQREMILFEISMAIGNSLLLQEMCKEALEAFVKKLNASSGVIFTQSDFSVSIIENMIISIPRRIRNLYIYDDLKNGLFQKGGINHSLFFEEKYYYLFRLDNVGYIGLQFTYSLDELILNSLNLLMRKLAVSIQACNDNAKLEKSLESAKVSEKIKGEFLANMSHEIRTPMNAILGMTDLALQEELSDKSRNYIQKANRAAESLLGIINDILDFSKMEAGKLELFNRHFELKDVILHTRHLIDVAVKEKNLKTKIIIAKTVPQVYCADSMRLGQVLTNLASNAVKFSHYNGSVTFKISLVEEDEQNALVEFNVEDEGIGISKENQEKLFRSFSQAESSTQRRFGGTGLGLAISKKIVTLMGGSIWVESIEGKGSVFSFRVKMQKSSKDAILETTEDNKQAMKLAIQKLKDLNVLLVEDNEINQELAMDILKKYRLHVTVANNGKEALQLLREKNFDIILMDLQMPVMDGYEATYKIREQKQYERLPIIAMTANVMSSDIKKARDAGMNDYIAKPINITNMLVTMAKWS